MSYNPATDFLGLLRLAGGGVQSERMPGLDYVVSALSRMGFVSLYVGQAAPTVDQSTTVWLQPASPSWSAEGTVWLWNAGATPPAYQAATPGLWTTFLQSIIISPAMIPVVAAATLALARTAMGLGSIATQNANAIAVTGGTIDGVAITNGTINGAAITATGAALTGGTINGAAITNGTINGATITGGTISGLTAPLAPASGGLGQTSWGAIDGRTQVETGAYAIVNADKRKTINCTGAAYYTISTGVVAGYDADFQVRVYNPDTRGKLISPNGVTPFILWPGQSCILHNTNGAWGVYPLTQRWLKAGLTLYVDPVLGSDSNDGLVPGVGGALLTLVQAYRVILRTMIDIQAAAPIIQLAAGTYNVGGGINVNYPLVGVGQFSIQGDSSSLNNAANYIISCSAGGNCFNVRDLATLTCVGMSFQTTGNGSIAWSVSNECNGDIDAIVFGTFPAGGWIDCTTHSDVNFKSACRFTGNTNNGWTVSLSGVIQCTSFTHEVSNVLAFANWAVASTTGSLNAGCGFSGPGSGAGSAGTKFNSASAGGIVFAGTVFPGGTAGTTTAPGWAA